MNIKAIAKNFYMKANYYLPWWITGIAVVGSVSAPIVAVMGKDRADEAMDKLPENPTVWDILKAVGPAYGPAVLIECLSVGAMIFATNVSWKRLGEAGKVINEINESYSKLKAGVTSTAGAAGLAAASAIVTEQENEMSEIEEDDDDVELWYDVSNNFWFRAREKDVLWSMYYSNGYLNQNMYLALEDFYKSAGVKEIPKRLNGFGWIIDDDYICSCESTYLEITYSQEKQRLDDGLEYRTISFWPEPKYYEELNYRYIDEEMIYNRLEH